MGRAGLVDVDLELREAPAEHARGAGVVQVDVGEQEGARLGATEPVDQRVEAGSGARVDDHAIQLVGADDPVTPQVKDVYEAAHRGPTIQSPRVRTPPARARPPVGDAHICGAFDRSGVQRAVPREPRQGPDGAVGGVRPAHADGVRPRPRARARRGREGRRVDRPQGRHAHAARRHPAGRDEHVDDDQRHGGVAARALHDGGGGERRGSCLASGHDAERHHQGVPLARDLRVPARAVDAADRGHDRVHGRRGAALEPDQHLLVPPAGGGRDAGAGDRVRALHGGGGAGPGAFSGAGVRFPPRVRADLVLRERGDPVRGGAREAAGDGPAVGGDRPLPLRGGRRSFSAGSATGCRSTRWG